jgi:hypothetical protein
MLDVAWSVRIGGVGEIALNRCMQPPRPWRQDTLAFFVDESGLMEGSSCVPGAQ